MIDSIAIFGAVTATVLALLRGAEFLKAERRAVSVVAFVERFWPARYQGEVVPLEEREWSGIRLHLVNEGRTVAIDLVGFLDRKTGKQYVIHGPQQLPAQLQPRDILDVRGQPGQEWRAVLREGATFIPYAEDTGGRKYRGKYDKDFHERVKQLVVQYDTEVTEA